MNQGEINSGDVRVVVKRDRAGAVLLADAGKIVGVVHPPGGDDIASRRKFREAVHAIAPTLDDALKGEPLAGVIVQQTKRAYRDPGRRLSLQRLKPSGDRPT